MQFYWLGNVLINNSVKTLTTSSLSVHGEEYKRHNARSNGFMFEVPKVKLQAAKSSFRAMGVKIYNDLPIKSRQTDNLLIFKEYKESL